MSDPNVQAVRQMPTWGKYLYDAFRGIQKQLRNVTIQTNASLTAQQNSPPSPLSAIHVDGGAGIYHVYLTDNNLNLYRGAEHTAYYSEAGDFSDWHPVHMGPARDIRLNLGIPGPLYFAAHHSYGPSSPGSTLIYFGGSMPTPVYATGAAAPPLRPGNGSGTNFPAQPPGGYGLLPYRGNTAPKR
jgi:hypothetical protein